jgi:thiamine biosynthesis lipoprotein
MIATVAPAVFRAMGTEVEVLTAPEIDDSDLERVKSWFDWVEARLSRFEPSSELSRMNAASGTPFATSRLLREVLAVALRAAEATDGLIDPTVLGCLERAGYARSFDGRGVRVATERSLRPDYRRVVVDVDGRVTFPAGMGIDLGGVAKGWTVGRSAPLLERYHRWLVNAGGDLLAGSRAGDGRGWTVGVEDPFRPGTDLLALRIDNMAVATSSVMRRRWRLGNSEMHHLIDPRTGRPVESDLAAVTVIHPSVVVAEVEAKAFLLLGRTRALHRADERGLSAVIVGDDGRLTFSGAAGEYAVG